jgi:hypothetical protein
MINDEIKLLIAKVNDLESYVRNNSTTTSPNIDLLEELSSACYDLIETIDNYLEN